MPRRRRGGALKTQGWLRRLIAELPGWHIWYSDGRRWYAVPAPADVDHTEALGMPYRLGPYSSPQALRAAARERYADGDHCQSCGDDWRRCGHRTPERRERP